MKICIPNSLRTAYLDLQADLPNIENFNRSHLDALSQAVFLDIRRLENTLKGAAEPGSEDWDEEEDQNAVLFLRDCLSGNKRLRGWIEDVTHVTDPIHY